MKKLLTIKVSTDEVYYGDNDHTLSVLIDMLERFVEDLRRKDRNYDPYCSMKAKRIIVRGTSRTKGTLKITEDR